METDTLPRKARHVLPLAVAIVALALGIAAGYLLRSGQAPATVDAGRWTVRALLGVTGELRDPSWDAAGTELVVAESVDGRSRVVAVSAADGAARSLHQAMDDEKLAWPRISPDGSLLAVTVSRGSVRSVRFVSLADSAPATELLDAAFASWLDDERVVFARLRGGTSSLWQYSIATGIEQAVLAASDELAWWYAIPRKDGALAVVGGRTVSSSGVFVLAPGGSSPRQWLAPGSSLTGVAWSPGGASLVAAAPRGLVRVTEGDTQPLLPALEVLRDPVFSPSGSRLAVVRVHSGSQLLLYEDIDPQAW